MLSALRKKRAKKALLESNFENRLSFAGESTKMELYRELSYGQPNGSLFFSQCEHQFLIIFVDQIHCLPASVKLCIVTKKEW